MIHHLFARIRQKYTRFPVSCGISFADSGGTAAFARANEKLLITCTLDNQRELETFLTQPHLPNVACFDVPPGERGNPLFASCVDLLRSEGIPVFFTEAGAVLGALGFATEQPDGLGPLLKETGLEMRPGPDVGTAASLAALTGFFYLNQEYEVIGKNVVPLLLEKDSFFSLVRRIPYGEVATYGEMAKELGLHWTEEKLMGELRRLPHGADVPGHRLVGRDGRLSQLFPGGIAVQKERLKWELVPFVEPDTIDLQKAKWTRNKYRALTNYLRNISAEHRFVEMNFDELERITGHLLPKAATRLGSWWRDEKPHAVIWQEAGWGISGVNLHHKAVTFVRRPQEKITE